MAYTLQAVVGDLNALKQHAPARAYVVALAQNMAMIPLTSEICEQLEIPFLPLTDQGATQLPETIETLAKQFGGQIAYIEAEFFGGAGTQGAAIWANGKLLFGPVINPSAINAALKKLGIDKGDHQDEFDALGLGDHRHTEDWIKATDQ